MRLTSQLAVIALLGAAGFGGWYAYKEGRLASVPVVGSYLPAPPPQATGPAGGGRRNEAVASVDVDIVKTGRIVETREAVGTVRAFESIIVTAKVAGIIDKIAFEEGQKVKAGDIIVSLDALERRAEILQRAAEINRATALRNEVATRLDRAQALRRTGSGTEAQVEDLSAQVKTLESAIASAEAQLKAADARLEDIVVRAPVRRPGRDARGVARRLCFARHADHDARRPLEGPARFLGARKSPRPAQVRASGERHLRGFP